MTDLECINRAVDFRKTNLPHLTTPIKVNLSPRELNDALRLPKPLFGHAYPTKVLWRGYHIQATKVKP